MGIPNSPAFKVYIKASQSYPTANKNSSKNLKLLIANNYPAEEKMSDKKKAKSDAAGGATAKSVNAFDAASKQFGMSLYNTLAEHNSVLIFIGDAALCWIMQLFRLYTLVLLRFIMSLQFQVPNMCVFATEEANVFFSPLSIAVALGMLFQGARGESAEEVAAAICLKGEGNSADASRALTAKAAKSLMDSLKNMKNKTLVLKMANSMFLEKKFKVSFSLLFN